MPERCDHTYVTILMQWIDVNGHIEMDVYVLREAEPSCTS